MVIEQFSSKIVFLDSAPLIYKTILTTAKGIQILAVNSAIAEDAARLRAMYKLKTPDAIQLATAIKVPVDYFLTNDLRLKVVSGATVVTLGELE